MRRALICFTLLLATTFTVQAQEREKTSGSTQKAITDLEQQWVAAVKAGNFDFVATLLPGNFTEMDSDGTVHNKAEYLGWIKGSKWEVNEISDLKVTEFGNTAVATGTWRGKGALGNGTPVDAHEHYMDMWMKMPNGKWQCFANANAPARASAAAETARDRLIGTWRLVSAGSLQPDGSFHPVPDYGPHAVGYLMYDTTGHMCVALGDPNPQHWADPAKPTEAERAQTHRAMVAYCGSYEVREKESRVIHRPELAEWPHYVGSDQVRDFRFEGDRLILSVEEARPGSEQAHYQITWQRVAH